MSGFPARVVLLALSCFLLVHCGSTGGGSGNLGGPTFGERSAQIAAEAPGDYYVGRRYFVEKTRFWGYIRKPNEPWRNAKLVIMTERQARNPDRLSENGPPGARYSYDNNYEYHIRGSFTGQEGYEPNSNQFLPKFTATSFEVTNRQPGWLFRPDDRYDRYRVTMTPH